MSKIERSRAIVAVLVLLLVSVTSCNFSQESMQPGEVRIVASEVSSIEFDSHTAQFNLVKKEGDWKLQHKNRLLPAENKTIENLLTLLNTINYSEPVTDDKDKWKNYLVNSGGTRITVKTPTQTSLDIIIGKFGMESAQVFHTFVRPMGQDYVYSSSQFMGINIGRTPESFRNKILARIDKKNLDTIIFNYGNGSSFELVKKNTEWQLEALPVDDIKIKNYLTQVDVIIGIDFFNDSNPLSNSLVSSIVFKSGSDSILLNAYSNKTDAWVFNSSQNRDNFFSDQRILELFKNKEDFLP